MKNPCVPRIFYPASFLLLVIFFMSDLYGQSMFRKVNDFDGDVRADYAVTRNENGLKIWYIWQSTDGFRAVHWGLHFDHIAAGDYDGDNKTDIAVYREPTNFPLRYSFWALTSQTGAIFHKEFSSISNFGSARMHQDYNGDGKTDAGVWFGSELGSTSILISNTGESGLTGGASVPRGDFPIRIGDVDGDRRADIAHRRSSDNLVTIRNSATNTVTTLQFGMFQDRFQAADFDGDGRSDLTIWRPSNGEWWWLRSSDNVVNAVVWGQNGDTPVPADYDGDGKTDQAIWRQGYYWILGSQTGISVFHWGLPDDMPVTY